MRVPIYRSTARAASFRDCARSGAASLCFDFCRCAGEREREGGREMKSRRWAIRYYIGVCMCACVRVYIEWGVAQSYTLEKSGIYYTCV